MRFNDEKPVLITGFFVGFKKWRERRLLKDFRLALED
ncbi:homoserine dehydrogenase [Bacillus sp. SG-1]|nr:homoserine dehydrogenase [Bacillus sp. SG-1]